MIKKYFRRDIANSYALTPDYQISKPVNRIIDQIFILFERSPEMKGTLNNIIGT